MIATVPIMLALFLIAEAASQVQYLQLARRQANGLADLIGSSAAEAMGRRDSETVMRRLEAAQSRADVLAAELVDGNGVRVAYVGRDGLFFRPEMLTRPPASYYAILRDGYLVVRRPVTSNGGSLGEIRLMVDQRALRAITLQESGAALIGVMIALLLGALAARQVARNVVRPIDALSAAAGQIAADRNYAGRVTGAEHDKEIGTLVQAFNGMLDEVQHRDQQMRRMADELEDTVAQRTGELQRQTVQTERARGRLAHAIRAARLSVFEWEIGSGVLHMAHGWLGTGDAPLTPHQLTEDQFIAVLHPDDAPSIRALIDRLRSGKLDRFRTEYRIRSRSLGWRWVVADGKVIDWNKDGGAIRAFGTQADQHARKLSEVELRAAKELAEAASRAKSRFLTHVSHELRTPLNGVIGMNDLLLAGNLDSGQRRMAEAVARSAQHLLDIINDLLEVSNLQSDQLAFDARDFDPARLIADALEGFATRAASKGLQLRQRIAPDVPKEVHGDPARLRQVLVHLIGNAVKFTREGSVEVALDVQGHEGDHWRLAFAVTDTGIGIPESVLAQIFEPFAQADSSATRPFGGMGLGLSIARRVVTALKGDLTVQSEVGRGSRFSFTVEYAAGTSAAAAASETPRHGATPCAGARVLVAEDNLVNQEVARQLLEQLGCRVTVVSDGAEVLRVLVADKHDLVLMDMQMPVMDGLTATRERRQQEKEQGLDRVPIVALTANATAAGRDLCIEAGMDDYLAKPIRHEDLVASLRANLPASAAVQGAGSVLDEQALQTLRRLSADGGQGMLVRVLRAYLQHSPALIDKLCCGLVEGDLRGAGLAAHSLQSSSAHVGAMEVVAEVARISPYARSDASAAPDDAQQLADRIRGAHERACKELALVLESAGERP